MLKLAGTSQWLPTGKSLKPADSLFATRSRQYRFFNFLLIPFSPVSCIENATFNLNKNFFSALE